MNEIGPNNHAHGGANADGIHQVRRPYWKRAHHDWRFWVAAALIFVCMVVYVLTVEFSLPPRGQAVPPTLAVPAG